MFIMLSFLIREFYFQVAIFVIVGIALMGAWLGYWGVRKMVLSEDGTIDVGTAQFVKWAIRIVASIMVLQVGCGFLFHSKTQKITKILL